MPVLTIAATIQNAIERSANAYEDAEGKDIDSVPEAARWLLYTNEMADMAGSWSDVYPLALELTCLHPAVLASLFYDLTASG